MLASFRGGTSSFVALAFRPGKATADNPKVQVSYRTLKTIGSRPKLEISSFRPFLFVASATQPSRNCVLSGR